MLAPHIDAFSNEKITIEEGIVKYYDQIYRRLLAMTRDRKLAEDLTQQTVEKVLKYRKLFQPGTNFRAWIFKIALHVFINDRRRTQILQGIKSHQVFLTMWGDPTSKMTETPENRVAGQISNKVRRILDEMPQEFQAVVLCVDLNDLSYKKTAETLDIPVGTVMSRLFRGRKLLRKALKTYADQEYGISYRTAA